MESHVCVQCGSGQAQAGGPMVAWAVAHASVPSVLPLCGLSGPVLASCVGGGLSCSGTVGGSWGLWVGWGACQVRPACVGWCRSAVGAWGGCRAVGSCWRLGRVAGVPWGLCACRWCMACGLGRGSVCSAKRVCGVARGVVCQWGAGMGCCRGCAWGCGCGCGVGTGRAGSAVVWGGWSGLGVRGRGRDWGTRSGGACGVPWARGGGGAAFPGAAGGGAGRVCVCRAER